MKTILFIFAISFSVLSIGQHKRFISTYKRESGTFKCLTVPMYYDTDSITRGRCGAKIGQVYRIDYVATSYNTSVSAYQKKLDEKRWNTLYAFAGIKSDKEIETNIYYQTAAKNEEEAKLLFHGFVVYYQQPTEYLHEISMGAMPLMINKMVGHPVTKETKSINFKKPIYLRTDSVGDITKTKMNELTRELEKNNVIVEWKYDSIGVNKVYYNAVYQLSKVTAGIFAAYTVLKDKSLLEMFRRLKTDKHTLIVTDMTGSMSPYYSQLLMWHALRMDEKKKENYVFFNDGDNKKQVEKIIGATGGLYDVSTSNLLEVYKSMSKCMAGGGGGDCPENNFEAVIHGINKCDSISRVILICDNWAVPRDRNLISNIKIPIDFVMCGATLGVNKEYLNLARNSRGHLHTVEKSITDLGDKKLGDKFSIGSRNYIITINGVEEKL